MTIGSMVLAAAVTVGTEAADGWKLINYEDKLTVSFGPALRVEGAAKKSDTAWNATSRRLQLEPGTREVEVGVYLKSTRGLGNPNAVADHGNCLIWYGANGDETGKSSLPLPCPSSTKPIWTQSAIAVPSNAVSFSIRVGFDRPDLGPSDLLEYSGFRYECFAEVGQAKDDIIIPDLHVPSIEVTGAGCFRIDDPSGVDEKSVRIAVDGQPVAAARQGLVWKVGSGEWAEGLHIAEITVANLSGNETKEKRAFYVGQLPNSTKVKLRDDGVALVNGQPFFPIGAYNVRRVKQNGMDFDRAFTELKSIGFNTAHTYEKVHEGINAGLMDYAEKHGFKLFINARDAVSNTNFVNLTRHHPAVIAWYLADDTSDNTSPEELRFLDSVAKALDPYRPTCQADGVSAGPLEKRGFSRCSNYITGADIVMPEIYPIRHDTKQDTHPICVARVRKDMRLLQRDLATRNNGRPRAIWPILQAFEGWERWKEFPTQQELYATTFAALAEGAQGMTWYTYHGWGKNHGIISKPEYFERTAFVSKRIQELVPVLLAYGRTTPKMKVLEGPQEDPYGAFPVVALQKQLEDKICIIAVNSAPAPLKLMFGVHGYRGAEQVSVRWENRTLELKRPGVFQDEFEAFGVHVYEISLPKVETVSREEVGAEGGVAKVANPAFDDSDGLAGWQVAAGIRTSVIRGEGYNGTAALRIDEQRDRVWEEWVSQPLALQRGQGYRVRARVKTQALVSDRASRGAQLVLRFLDAAGGKLMDVATPVLKGDTDWSELSVTVPSVPSATAKSLLLLTTGTFAKGTAWFDDIEVAELDGSPLTGLYSSGWRDQAAAGEVRLVAALALESAASAEVEFAWTGSDGKVHRRAASRLTPELAEITLPVVELMPGKYPLAAELRVGGRRVARKVLEFTRVASFPERGVRHDGEGRFIVDGQPFFPLAMYAGEVTPAMLDEYLEAPFNTVLPYPEVGEQMLSECARRGLKVIFGQSSNWPWTRWSQDRGTVTDEASDRYVAALVSGLKEHPAILGWYINDEIPFSRMGDVRRRYALIRERDPNHPVVTVNFHVDMITPFLSASDVIGTDPYPYPKDQLSMVRDWTLKTRRGVFGMRPVLMAPQAFDWKDYSKVHGEGFPPYRELRNMAWQAIAAGANGLVFYSYGAMKKNFRGRPEEFRRHWQDVVRLVKEIKACEPWLVSAEPAPTVTSDSPDILKRAFSFRGEVKVLTVNCRAPYAVEWNLL